MPFVITSELNALPGFEDLKSEGDRLMEEAGLIDFNVEIRPATDIEEKNMAGRGLAPGPDTGDSYIADEKRHIIYRTEEATNPLLEDVESKPKNAAAKIVDRLKVHAERHH